MNTALLAMSLLAPLGLALACGGEASTSADGTGGAIGSSGGSTSASGGAGAGGLGGAPVGGAGTGGEALAELCVDLREAAQSRFYDELYEPPGCDSDDDCSEAHASCVATCGIVTSTQVTGLESTLDAACTEFFAAGCNTFQFQHPCLAHDPPTCIDGVCGW